MRFCLAVFLVLAACGSKQSSAPAWPKSAAKETDGGESLAPRSKAAAVAAAASDDDEIKLDVTPSTDKPAAKTDDKSDTPKPATLGIPQVSDTDLIITTEEIVIEIDE